MPTSDATIPSPTGASPAATPETAEESFRKGLDALEGRRYKEAMALFRAAMEQEGEESRGKKRWMRYASYLGLALALDGGHSLEGMKLCQQAVTREFLDPDLYCNLGIVCLRNRDKKLAFEAFHKGLALKPGHARILEELSRYERRRALIFKSLSRDHPLNRIAGLLRYRTLQFLSRFLPSED